MKGGENVHVDALELVKGMVHLPSLGLHAKALFPVT